MKGQINNRFDDQATHFNQQLAKFDNKFESQSVRFMEIENKIDENSREMENNFQQWTNTVKEGCETINQKTRDAVVEQIKNFMLSNAKKFDAVDDKIQKMITELTQKLENIILENRQTSINRELIQQLVRSEIGHLCHLQETEIAPSKSTHQLEKEIERTWNHHEKFSGTFNVQTPNSKQFLMEFEHFLNVRNFDRDIGKESLYL